MFQNRMAPQSGSRGSPMTVQGTGVPLLFMTAITWSMSSRGTSVSVRVAVVASPGTFLFEVPSTRMSVITPGSALGGLTQATVTVPSGFLSQVTLRTGSGQRVGSGLVGSTNWSLPKTPG